MTWKGVKSASKARRMRKRRRGGWDSGDATILMGAKIGVTRRIYNPI